MDRDLRPECKNLCPNLAELEFDLKPYKQALKIRKANIALLNVSSLPVIYFCTSNKI